MDFLYVSGFFYREGEEEMSEKDTCGKESLPSEVECWSLERSFLNLLGPELCVDPYKSKMQLETALARDEYSSFFSLNDWISCG